MLELTDNFKNIKTNDLRNIMRVTAEHDTFWLEEDGVQTAIIGAVRNVFEDVKSSSETNINDK